VRRGRADAGDLAVAAVEDHVGAAVERLGAGRARPRRVDDVVAGLVAGSVAFQ
jgi:hypothetical protein